MKLRLDEIVIDGKVHSIEYNDKYANGWHYEVDSLKERADKYLNMIAKKRSPFKKDRDDYEAWREAKKIIHGAKVTAIQKVIDSLEEINNGPLSIIPEDIIPEDTGGEEE